ncbi:MAG: dTDP-glucose 4,6-dehydratase [Candidatus Peribacteria bacterium]|nr:dTDP-glucose 4,6-dehydratase [Candidatus Peribacteria bacterium]
MNLLVTGGAGFIGSHFVLRHIEQYPDDTIVVLDTMTYAADKTFLQPVLQRIRFIEGDIADIELVSRLVLTYGIEVIVNFAAETHVDRSIQNAVPFIHSNIIGVQGLIEVCRASPDLLLIQISTDEVYGDLASGEEPFSLNSALKPSSPYAASKASGDLLLMAAVRTYGIRVRMTRCTNNYGPHQDASKLLPVIIHNALQNKKIPIYGEGRQSRDWLYVTDHNDAVELVIQKGQDGHIYLIGAGNEHENIQVATTVLNVMGKSADLIQFVPDRPGHDWRYTLDSSSIRALGWEPKVTFEDGIRKTVDWYRHR